MPLSYLLSDDASAWVDTGIIGAVCLVIDRNPPASYCIKVLKLSSFIVVLSEELYQAMFYRCFFASLVISPLSLQRNVDICHFHLARHLWIQDLFQPLFFFLFCWFCCCGGAGGGAGGFGAIFIVVVVVAVVVVFAGLALLLLPVVLMSLTRLLFHPAGTRKLNFTWLKQKAVSWAYRLPQWKSRKVLQRRWNR